MGATRLWTRWVNLKVVGQFGSGSLTGWVDRFVGSWRDLTGAGVKLVDACLCDQKGVRVREDGEYRVREE